MKTATVLMQNAPVNRASIDRRQFLRTGAVGIGGLTLIDVLRKEAGANVATPKRPKSLIYVVLSGGPSHIDMYDLKPDAPSEFRGPFRPIPTSLPGCEICELMPEQAKLMYRLALIRGMRSVENDHFLSEVYTGLPRSAGKRPAFGSLISRVSAAESPSRIPRYVSLDRQTQNNENDFEQPQYAGAGLGPFRPFDEALNDLAAVTSLDRLHDRRSLLSAFDRLRRSVDHVRDFEAFDRYQEHALEIITSSTVRDAFDLEKEPPGMLARYGHNQGQYTHQTVKHLHYPWEAKSFVLARRLIEAGVRLVTISVGNWDHHSSPQADIFYSLSKMLPALDRTLAALFSDLQERGLDQDVGVVVLGEFGRTPKISTNMSGVGREHWADAGCALFFGGGWKTGQVIGTTDARAERSVDGTIGFQNIMATIYRLFGIDPQATIPDFNGRPQYLLNDVEPIRALTA